MAQDGQLESDMLFLGLTRPPMMFGVSYTFVGLNFFLTMVLYIGLDSGIKTFLMIPLGHAIGYYFTQREALFLELFMTKQTKCNRCKNRIYHGFTNSYDVT